MEVYIARQPIFTKHKTVAGYELLYRSSAENMFDSSVDGSHATSAVISEALLDFGMDALTGGKKGFVNFTAQLLAQRVPELLEPEHFVIEVLETVRLEAAVLERLIQLQEMGYTLALDDYCGAELGEQALRCFDIIKLDFRLVEPGERGRLAIPLRQAGKRILAEKVETAQDFAEAASIGCELFQGYYFAKPLMLQSKRRDIAGITSMRLAHALSRNDVDIGKLASIIRTDAHLVLALLRKMSTLQYYRGRPVKSVQEALLHMGLQETRRWVMLVLLRDLTGKNMDELIRMALIRAVFCEKLALRTGKRAMQSDAFIMGMLSIIDRDSPDYTHLMQDLSVSEPVRQGLSDPESALGRLLAAVLHYEAGEWDEIHGLAPNLSALYHEAVLYADTMLRDNRQDTGDEPPADKF